MQSDRPPILFWAKSVDVCPTEPVTSDDPLEQPDQRSARPSSIRSTDAVTDAVALVSD